MCSKAGFWGAAILGVFLAAGMTARAATYVQTVNESASGDWTQAIWGSPATAATAGNSYLVPSAFALRTVNTAANQSFAGDDLTVTNGGILYLKHAGGVATVNLYLGGGQIIMHGGGTGATYTPLAGALHITADPAAAYSIGSDQSSGNHDIWLYSTISGTNNVTINMLANTPNTVALYGTNTAFSGNWTNDNGRIEIRSGSVNALGSGSVIMTKTSTSLSFNTTNGLLIANGIYGNGYVLKLNTNTVILTATNTYTGQTVISNGVLQISNSAAIPGTSTISLAGGTLDASAVGGLVLNGGSSQAMNCNGTLIGGLTASSGNTLNFNLTSSTNDILNVTGTLTLSGNPTINLTLAGFKPSGTYRLINYSGTIQGGGSFNLIPPAGSTESFTLDTSVPGQVNVTVTGSQRHLIWQGNSSSTWDTSAANWTGDATVYGLGDSVTFNDSGNPSSTFVLISGSGLYPGSMTVSNTSLQYIFYGSSSDGLICSGTFTKQGTNEVDLATSGNNFSGPIDIQAGILSLGAGSSYGSLGTGPITNNGILRINMSSPAVALNAPISGSGSLEITGGGANVNMGGNAHNTYTGLTTINDGCQLNIALNDALGSANAGTIVLPNGRLGVASYVGAMTVLEPLTISGTGVSGAPGALYLNTSGNNVTWAGPVTIAGDTQIRVVNANVRMNLSNKVLGTNVALQCTAGNAASPSTDGSAIIDFQGVLSLGASGSLLADSVGTVYLSGSTNVWGGGTTVTRGTLRVNGKLDGGAVVIDPGTNSATLAGSGVILGTLAVQPNAILSPGEYSAVGTLTVSNSVTLSGATVMRLDRNNSQKSDRLAATSVALGGALTVTNIGAALQAGDTFQLFTGSLSGAFVTTNLPTLTSPLFWDTSQFSSGILVVGSTQPPAPVTGAPTVSGTNFVWSTSSVLGFNYILQATASLTPPVVWTGLQTNAGTGATLNFTNPVTSSFPQRFFRIEVQ